MGRTAETARVGRVVWVGRPRLRGREGCVGRTAETAREGRLYGEDGRDCEGGRFVWVGGPRLRGEEGLCGEDGRDCEGSVGYLGRAVVKGGSVVWEGRFETAWRGRVVWGGRPRLRGRLG